MNCPNCHLPTEPTADFCGNCGTQLRDDAAVAKALAAAEAPAYALPLPGQHALETQAVLSLLCGCMGLVGALFMPLMGLGFGLIGLVLGTISRSAARRSLSTIGLVVSGLAIMAGLVTWVYVIKHTAAAKAAQDTVAASATSNLSTPCYSLEFVSKFNITKTANSCSLNAFDGQTLTDSTDAYKIYANQTTVTDVNSFTVVAKRAIHKDIEQNLPGFAIDVEQVSQFAGSPAYIINASDKIHNIAVVEAAVLHQASNGDNVFLMVHARTSNSADLNTLEAQWQWK